MSDKSTTIKNIRFEVMQTLEKQVDQFMTKFLMKPDKFWQPTDFLPNSQKETFLEEIKEIQELSKELDDDFWVVLVGDTVTEEALPTYESWLMNIEGISQSPDNGWAKWIRAWTSEEKNHGNVLNKYLYLSGRVNMREVEISTQHLITDGFDIGTARDPYKNFVYTSFQELATYISHINVAQMAKAKGHNALAKMSKVIAGDEMRHHIAYSHFIKEIFKIDPSEMMIAYRDMLKHKIVMPAMYLRESSENQGDMFDKFATVAQRIGVYTSFDYVDIIKKLNSLWEIDQIRGLTDEAQKARDYLLKMPKIMSRIAERIEIPTTKYNFKWMIPAV